jgi:uncharacterized membrane protein
LSANQGSINFLFVVFHVAWSQDVQNVSEKLCKEIVGVYMTIYLFALLLGIIAGLRSLTALAMVSWAANLGWPSVSGTWLGFFGNPWVCGILSLLALVELVYDQLPTTPSRTAPVAFGARILSGAISGAAIATAGGVLMVGGLFAGIVGAIIGTLGGSVFRARLTAVFGKDRPAAFIEDAVAIGGALLIWIALL